MTGSLQVLVVDDDPFIRDVLPPLLAAARVRGRDLQVEAVGSAAEATAWLTRHPAGDRVVLSDHNLQATRTGLDLLVELAQTDPGVIRILFSGHSRNEIPGLAKADIHGFLEKPFRLDDLVAPFQALVAHAMESGAGPRREPKPVSAATLDEREVLQGIVRAELKGEHDRSRLLFGEAERRGAAGEASRLALDALSWQNRILELVARQAPLDDILENLAKSIERLFPDGLAAILLVDAAGARLRVRAAPSMPADYVATIDGLLLIPPESPCAAAVNEKRRVIVTDFGARPEWAKVREAGARHGIKAWWSIPILATDGTCRGTFALHGRSKRVPDQHELQLIDLATGLARLALDSHGNIAALRQAEERMSSIVAASLDAIVSMDARGNVLEWNPSAERIFSRPREQAIGRPMADLIVPPELRAAHWAGLRRYLETGEARVLGRKIEITAMRADGTTFPVELAIVRLATQGAPTFTAFIRDLSDRARQSEQLRDSNERLRAIFEQVSVGVAQFDLQGRFRLVNDRYCQIVGRPRASLMTLAMDDVTAPEYVARDRALFERVVATGHDAVMDSRFVRPDRDNVWVRRSLSLVRDAKGDPALVVGVVQEITEQKQAEERLRELNASLDARVKERTKALEEANRDLGSFSYIVSHDLRAPLRMLSYLVGNAMAHPTSGAVREDLAKALQAVETMANLMEGMLTLARVSQDEVRRERVDLTEMARQVVAQQRITSPGREVRVQVEEGMEANGDPRLLWSVLDNLVGNAWKFTAGRAVAAISIGTRPSDAGLVYFVSDNGRGFPNAEAGRLFQPFTRLNPSEGPPGIGIGLATVRRIIERHGGRIWAEGREGEGATFSFTLG